MGTLVKQEHVSSSWRAGTPGARVSEKQLEGGEGVTEQLEEATAPLWRTLGTSSFCL